MAVVDCICNLRLNISYLYPVEYYGPMPSGPQGATSGGGSLHLFSAFLRPPPGSAPAPSGASPGVPGGTPPRALAGPLTFATTTTSLHLPATHYCEGLSFSSSLNMANYCSLLAQALSEISFSLHLLVASKLLTLSRRNTTTLKRSICLSLLWLQFSRL